MGNEDEDPYGGDWGDLGGWPEPVLPPDEEETPAGPEPGEAPAEEGPPPGWPAEEGPPPGWPAEEDAGS